MVEYASLSRQNRPSTNDNNQNSDGNTKSSNSKKKKENKDDVFSDSDTEDNRSPNRRSAQHSSNIGEQVNAVRLTSNATNEETSKTVAGVGEISSKDGKAEATVATEKEEASGPSLQEAAPTNSNSVSEFKAIAADASVFSFGDEEDYESE